jgi:heptosyltransferase-1
VPAGNHLRVAGAGGVRPVKRVLLVRLSSLGDVVQSLGAVAALAQARPDLELLFCTQRPYLPLLRGLPLRAVVPFDRGGGLRGLLRLRAGLRALRPDAALDLQGNWKSAAACRLSGARERIGAGARWRQEPRSRWLLTRRVEVDGPRHPALVAYAVVRALAPTAALRLPRLDPEAAEIEQAAADLRALALDPTRPVRVLVPGDPSDPRSLRPEFHAAELARSPHPVLWLLGPDEAGPPPGGAPGLRHGRGELLRLVALGGLLFRIGGDAVGPDQGPMHVLAACGVRTALLFGPQDPARTAPSGVRVLQHPAPPPCMPCRSRSCSHPAGPVCMAFTSGEGVEVARPDWLGAAAR